MATWFECAAFSLHVYRDKDQPPLPDGWSILVNCPDELQSEDYYATAYIALLDHIDGYSSYEVVIAHRGTVISTGDIFNDFEILFGETPSQFAKGAYLFDEYVRQYMNNNYPQPNNFYFITHTGHSLGAILAELCVASSARFLETAGACMGTTFESPGSKAMIADMEAKGQLPPGASSYVQEVMVTANADVNAINSYAEHISGSVDFPCYVGYSYVKSDLCGYPIPPSSIYFFADFTVADQHKMVKMYHYWNNDTRKFLKPKCRYDGVSKREGDDNFQWPIGFDNAYQYYLDYIPYGTKYWDSYIPLCWDNHPELHQAYDNYEWKFYDYFVKTFLRNDYSNVNSTAASNPRFFKQQRDTRENFALMDEVNVAEVQSGEAPAPKGSSSWSCIIA